MTCLDAFLNFGSEVLCTFVGTVGGGEVDLSGMSADHWGCDGVLGKVPPPWPHILRSCDSAEAEFCYQSTKKNYDAVILTKT